MRFAIVAAALVSATATASPAAVTYQGFGSLATGQLATTTQGDGRYRAIFSFYPDAGIEDVSTYADLDVVRERPCDDPGAGGWCFQDGGSQPIRPTISYDEGHIIFDWILAWDGCSGPYEGYRCSYRLHTLSAAVTFDKPVSWTVTAGWLQQGVPEPASWLMMIAGFGLAGAAIRSARSARRAPSTSFLPRLESET